MTTITSEPKAEVGGLVEYPPTEDASAAGTSGASNILSETVDELVNSNDLTTESIAKAISNMPTDATQLAAMLSESHHEHQQPADELNRYVQMLQQQRQVPIQPAPHMHPVTNQTTTQAPPMLLEMEDPEDSDDDGNGRSEKRAGRRKIRIEYIEDKSRRHITFSKRKAGIMKKAYELSTLTGTQVLLLVASETGHVYTFATPKLQPLITKPEGKNLIQACLNAPDGAEYGHHSSAGYGEDEAEERQIPTSNAGSSLASLSSNYAAAMAGLAGYPYPQQGIQNASNNSAVAQAYAHYPASYAAQYNAALAAGYWPQGTSPQGHDRAAGSGSVNASGEDQNEGQN